VFGNYKPKDQKEPEPEPERVLTEFEEILALRYVRLLALGLAPHQAISLIETPDIAARAEALYAKGCPPDLILEILT